MLAMSPIAGAPIAALYVPAGATVPATPTVASVTITPASLTMDGGSSQQFAATVTGTNSPSQAGTWSATAGAIVAGLFMAPAATNSVQSIVITFTSTQDPSKSGSATITIPALVVTPPGPVVAPAPTAADIHVFTIMRISTVNLQTQLGPAAINLTVSLT